MVALLYEPDHGP